MNRVRHALLVAPLVLLALLGRAPLAEGELPMKEADKLFATGKYAAALQRYQGVIAHPPDERTGTRATFRAYECLTALGQYEGGLELARAAKAPADARLRGILALGRLQMFESVSNVYGFAQETEEGAQGSAKLSKAQVSRESEAAVQDLWSRRAELGRSPLREWGDFLQLRNVDGARYPSLWDFAVLKLRDVLQGQLLLDNGSRAEPAAFAVEDFGRAFEAGRPSLARLGALYEESGHLEGGTVDRALAGERWRVARVMLGGEQAGSAARKKAWQTAAEARLLGWVKSLKTPLGRAEAALEAARLRQVTQRPALALQLVDATLPNTPESDVAVALRSLRAEILNVEVSLTARTTRDGKHALHVRTRNLAHLNLRLYKVDPLTLNRRGWSLDDPDDVRHQKLLASKPAAQWTADLHDKQDHLPIEQDLDLPAGTGFYVVFASDGAFTVEKALINSAYVNVTDLAIASAGGPGTSRFYAFDAARGEPENGVNFHVRETDYNGQTHATADVKTSGDGLGSWTWPPAGNVYTVDVLAARGPAVALFPHGLYRTSQAIEPALAIYLATDRPIYRPGQTLKVRATSIQRGTDGNRKIDAGRKLVVQLMSPNWQEVGSHEVVTDALGSGTTEFALPQQGLLGTFQLIVKAADGSGQGGAQVQVEEYKRPEFEVTLDAPRGAGHYSDKTSLTGNVKYYFGGAAAGLAVKFKVSRQRWIPWWYYFRRRGESAKVEIARGEAQTDKAGQFTVEFTAIPDPDATSDDVDLPDVSDFVVEVEAHDAGGRTIPATRSLRVGAQSLLIQADSERTFFLSNEKAQLRVKATNLEEQPQAVALTWELERLGPPPPARDEDQEAPLAGQLARYPAAGPAIAHGAVAPTATDPGHLELGPLPAGGYRLRVQGAGARTSYAFLVADAQTRTMPLAVGPVALVRTARSQPGESVDLLIGAAGASGAYHLEIWRGETLVSHRVERGGAVRVWTIPVEQRLAGGFTARWIGVRGVNAVGADAAVSVPRLDRALTVKLVGKPEALEPGQKSRLTVQVVDGLGKAVPGAALVTIYDRSLELYAGARRGWIEDLWAPPPAPQQRVDGVASQAGNAISADEAGANKRQKAIAGKYREFELPRFSWDVSSRPHGMRVMSAPMRMMKGEGAAGAMPPPAPAPMEMARRSGAAEDKMAEPEMSKPSAPPAAPPAPRTNMAETALFLPDLRFGPDGRGQFDFTGPERLTSWRIQTLALGTQVQGGTGDDTIVTRKNLMVRVEIPRFFREGDRSTITAVVHNETGAALQAQVDVSVVEDAPGGKPAGAALGLGEARRSVSVPAHGLAPVEFPIEARGALASYKIRAQATAGALSDAEERALPILPSRERLVQSQVVALRGNEHKSLAFEELLHGKDPSLRSESMTVSIDPQLALAALRAIPSLVEYPFECVEQVLNRYVPLAIVNQIYKKYPELAKVAAAAPPRTTQYEPWTASDPRRTLMLSESPWLQQSQGGRSDALLRQLLDPKAVAEMGTTALEKLTHAQRPSGGFSWFPGGHEDLYMTLYVLEQLALLQEFGVAAPHDVADRALGWVGHEMAKYNKKDTASLAFLAYASFVVTSFDAQAFPAAAALRGAAATWIKWALDNRPVLTPFGRAWCARVEARLGNQKLALELLESALDGAKRDPLIGVHWAPERYSWMWYSDTVEKHAFLLRTLAELKPDDERVPGMLQWLLFNRKGNQWHSTKASAAAVYSILALMQKQGSLTQPEIFQVAWGQQHESVTVKATEDRREPLLWTTTGAEVTAARGKVEVSKQGPGIAFASATWIYSSTKLQEAHPSQLLAVDRAYFRRVHQADGDHLVPLHSGDKVRVGEDIEVRLRVAAKSQFQYVHVKEPRGAGFEETTLVSGYRWDPLPAYQEPRDSLFNFFVDWLPHGEFELRHSLRPTTPGVYRIGSAVAQSMYSPDVTAYSAGMVLEVTK